MAASAWRAKTMERIPVGMAMSGIQEKDQGNHAPGHRPPRIGVDRSKRGDPFAFGELVERGERSSRRHDVGQCPPQGGLSALRQRLAAVSG